VKTLVKITSGVGIATLLFAGYVALMGASELARYIRISKM
jgi:hypothetical protein